MFGVLFKAFFFFILFFFPPIIKTQLDTDELSALGLIVCFCARERQGKVKIAEATMGNSWVQCFPGCFARPASS